MAIQLAWRPYIFLSIVYMAILLTLFFIIDIIHFRYFSPPIVLNAVFLDITLTIILTLFIIKSIKLLPFNGILLVNACIIFLFLASLYNVLIPTMCDRSLSVFILTQLKTADDSQKKITVNDLVKITDAKYVRGPHMVEKRLIEQQTNGAIKIENNVIILTARGKLAAFIFEFFSKILKIQSTF